MSAGDTGQQTAIRTASAHMNAGRLAEAEALCRGILMAAPDHIQAVLILGGIAMKQGRAEAAIEHFHHAVAIAPRAVETHSNLGAALLAAGRPEDAVGVLKTAIKNNPHYGLVYINLGDALMKLGRFTDAAAALRRAVALEPFDARGHVNLGAALTRLMQLDEAVEALRRAIDLDPKLAQAHDNLGAAYSALGRLDAAAACHTRAVALQPGFRDAINNRSMIYLTQGRFADGWRDYMDRFSVRKMTVPLHRVPLAPDLSGLRILLGKDQGLGDEIFFLRFAPELKRRGAHITYLAGDKIASLFRRLPFLDAVADEGVLRESWDMVVSIGDLPHMTGMASAADVPQSITLPVLPDRLAVQQANLSALGPPPYIGVTWRAGLDQARSLYKTVPLERIGAALRKTRGTLIALQRLPEKGEIRRLAKAAGRPIHDLTALNDQLEDMLALLSLLDDYVTVSNTNVHLRAAAGGAGSRGARQGRVLVPHPPEFRWMAAGSVSPWFPDCAVYRQGVSGSWDAAFAVLESDLENQSKGRG